MVAGGFIAVHVGAGFHAQVNENRHRMACKQACVEASKVLREGGCASLACVAAIRALEDDPATNAGLGSSLNRDGRVECDAGFMDGTTMKFGAIGCAPRIDVIEASLNLC